MDKIFSTLSMCVILIGILNITMLETQVSVQKEL